MAKRQKTMSTKTKRHEEDYTVCGPVPDGRDEHGRQIYTAVIFAPVMVHRYQQGNADVRRTLVGCTKKEAVQTLQADAKRLNKRIPEAARLFCAQAHSKRGLELHRGS